MPRIDKPEPGYFRLRAYRAGPWMPASIYWAWPLDPHTGEVLDRSPHLEAEIDSNPVDIFDVWIYGERIDLGEYQWTKALYAIQKRRMTPAQRRAETGLGATDWLKDEFRAAPASTSES